MQPTVKISNLPKSSSPAATDKVPLVHGSETDYSLLSDLITFFFNNIPTGGIPGLTDGWIAGQLPAVSSVTCNGNRSYDVVFASTVAALLTPGMRVRATRTVAAPTQCTDLESGSSQYYSKTSPNGLSFTTTYTCSAWIKLESYTEGGIIARRNADTEGWSFYIGSTGQLLLASLRIAGNNKVATSYQSVPLNRWVHVAASMDVSVAGDASTVMYMDGVVVPSSVATNGTCTALVQGTTALVVGAEKSAGTLPFDGKIAQAAVFSSVLSAATIRSYMSQALSGAESTNVSAYSLNGIITDLNANANDLTANGGAVATNADSPFSQDANGVIGSYDFGIVTKVATTTATVQVPEGNAIPTTGGVTTVDLSPHKAPYGFPAQASRWRLVSILVVTATNTSNVTFGSFQSGGWSLTVPIGDWSIGWMAGTYNATTTTSYWNVSPSALTGLTQYAALAVSRLQVVTVSPSAATTVNTANINVRSNLAAATTYVMYTLGATASAGITSNDATAEIYAELALL